MAVRQPALVEVEHVTQSYGAGSRRFVAVREVSRLKMVVVGSAEIPEEQAYERRLRELVRELGVADRVCFAGARRDIPSVFKALDVALLTSRHEGFGRVVPEAMAAGVPVVLTREGALPELIEEGREGYLAAPKDAEGFAARIVELARDVGLRRLVGERAASSARRFSPEIAAGLVWAAYAAVTRLPG